jgi:PAS domain S-box-containing protein
MTERTADALGILDDPDLFRAAWDSHYQAVVFVDEQLLIRYSNRRAQLLFGYGADEMRGKPVSDLTPDDVHPHHDALIQGYHADPRQRPMGAGNLRARHKSGREFPVDISLDPQQTRFHGLITIATISLRKEPQILARPREADDGGR